LYSNKNLTFEFENYSGAFDDKGNTKISLAGDVKATCRVSYTGNIGGFQAETTIYGLSLEMIATLSAKGIGPYTQQDARISMVIYANGTEIFSGFIYSAYANMNAVPDAGLIIQANAGLELARRAAKPFSQPDGQEVKSIIDAICKNNGYNLLATGIDGIIGTNTYLTGSALDQIRFACNQSNLSMSVNGKNVTVWKPGTSVDDVIPLVSKDFGLIGYPVFTPSGITFQTQFTTYLAQGRYVKLQTDLPHATGTYQAFAVDHYLSSWIKDGPWLTVVQATKVITVEQPKQ